MVMNFWIKKKNRYVLSPPFLSDLSPLNYLFKIGKLYLAIWCVVSIRSYHIFHGWWFQENKPIGKVFFLKNNLAVLLNKYSKYKQKELGSPWRLFLWSENSDSNSLKFGWRIGIIYMQLNKNPLEEL